MFICQIVASRGNGGLEKHVRDLSSCLVKKGHRVFVIGSTEFIKTLSPGVESVSVNMNLSRHNPWLLYQIYLILRKEKFDVIHAQANKATSMLMSIKWLLKAPIVATLHNIKSQFNIYRRVKHVICVSHYLAELVKNNGSEVIYNGISQNTKNHQLDLKSIYNLSAEKPIICSVGRLVSAKGFDVLLEAIDGLNISLIIAGDGPQSDALQKRINSLQPNTEVRLIGHYDNPSELMFSSIGVVISSRREGFSYVFNEALLCGANILSTDVPVANEVLPNQLITAVENSIKLREKLITLLENPKQWSAMMKEPQLFAKLEMTIDRMTEKTISIYERIRE